MKAYRVTSCLAACGALAVAFACNAQRASSSDTRAADEAAIRAADAAWSQASKNADAMLAYYADDATILAPNTPMASDGQARRKVITDLFAAPGASVSWQASKVEVASSGDIGYSLGTYQATMNDANGNPVSDHGKYTTVWRKQPDGSWKVIVDMFNTDLPAAAPEKSK